MKTITCFSIFVCLINLLISQSELIWKYPESGQSGINNLIKSDTILLVKQINNNDNINFNNTSINIDCVLNNEINIKITRINDSAYFTVCNKLVKAKIRNDNVILTNNDNFQFILSFTNLKSDASKNNDDIKLFDTTRNIYYDALILETGEDLSKIFIFNKYNIDSSTKVNNFLLEIKNKAFANQSKNTKSAIQALNDNKNKNLVKTGSSTFSSILGIDVTSLADGLAEFLVSRVKKEMAIALFDDLSKRIRSDNTKDVQILFKNTYEVLDLLGDKIYDFQPYISSLRQNMEYDFQNLPQSFQTLLESDDSHLHQLLNQHTNLLYLTGNSLDLGMEIKENTHFGKALGLHDFKKYNVNVDTSIIGTLQTLQLFSEALRDTFTTDTMPYWIDKSKINKLINDPELLKCFIGLLAEVANKDSILITPKLSLYDYLNDSIGPQGVNKFSAFLKSLQNNINQIQLIHTKNRMTHTEDDQKLNVVNYFDAATSLLESSKYLIKLFKKVDNLAQIDTFFTIASNINSIIKYSVTKKYTLSAMHLSKVMSYFASSPRSAFKTISFVVDKAMILGQLAEAQTADEVKEVIESFAAPVGSWRDKRIARFNMALDSYIGPGYINANSTNNSEAVKYSNWTVSTPVGLTASFKLKNWAH
ncbi:MAG: hypothetical protein IPP42_07435 [Saprospiraceae bacterium]|nr:hypothetical protein [Saprospiraceae bacterium]